MKKSEKQVVIDEMILCFENGQGRDKILAKVGKKWQLKVRTFDRYLTIAREQHQEAQNKIKTRLAEVNAQTAIDTRKSQIADQEERKLILSQIARGDIKIKKPFVMNGKGDAPSKIVEYSAEPNCDERKAAIAELNRMDGAHAPRKNLFGNDPDNPLPDPDPVDYSLLSFDELMTLKNLHDKCKQPAKKNDA